MDASATGPAPSDQLDRHEQRRAAGLPTVSVLSGPVGLTVALARRWGEARRQPLAVVSGTSLECLIDAWVDVLAAGRDLRHDAAAWLAVRVDRPVAELGPALERLTSFEREVLLETALPAEPGNDAVTACRWLLERSAGEARAPGLARRLGDGSCESGIKALHALIPHGAAPALLVIAPPAAASVEAAAASLARLAEAEPCLTLILAAEPGALAAYQQVAPESRAKTLIRSGTILVTVPGEPEIGRRLDAAIAGASRHFAGPIRRLAADGASDRVVDLFRDAASAAAASGRKSDPHQDGLARSAAERFLFERLETLPQTSGRFALNNKLEIPFGPARTMEVDLVARDLAVAIEVDGYYHFVDADAYRRDRRKDLALQQRGYLVVRVLADDVVERLEEVLDQILEAVATSRAKAHDS